MFKEINLGMVDHLIGPGVQSQPWLHSQLEVNMGQKRLSQNTRGRCGGFTDASWHNRRTASHYSKTALSLFFLAFLYSTVR